MRYNSLGSIALDASATPKAVCGWLDDITAGPFQREISLDVFELVIRRGAVISNTDPVLAGVTGGANFVASGGGRWMRRLDGAIPELTGSQAWEPSDGRIGDIAFNGTAIVLDEDATTASVYIGGLYDHSFARGTANTRPFGDLRLSASGEYAIWTQFPGPRVVVYNIISREYVSVASLTTDEGQYYPAVLDDPSGLWVTYQTDTYGGVVHRIDNSVFGYRYGTAGAIYDPDIIAWGASGGRLGWSTDAAQSTQEEIIVSTLGSNMVLLSDGTTSRTSLTSKTPIPPISRGVGGAPIGGALTGGATPANTNVLTTNTRVFRQPQTIPPTAKVLNAFGKTGTVVAAVDAMKALKDAIAKNGPLAATTLGAGAGTIEEDTPAYNPKYPFNTILIESESGHLIEIDDTPKAERVHIFHMSGSHIEMRPDGGVKYKTVKKRQDITIGHNEVMIQGDCDIVVDGGYTLRVVKGELIINAEAAASISVKGALKITADDIEMKASKRIFLNAPRVDLGGMSPGGMPMMSLPTGIIPYPAPSIVPIFIPTVKMPLSPAGVTQMIALSKQIKESLVPLDSSLGLKMNSILSATAQDASGEPAFSKLQEQPTEIPMSNPALYGNNLSNPKKYQQLRGRLFDTPEDVGNSESYDAHNSLSIELGDFTQNQKTGPGTILCSDITTPVDEPRPATTFPLPSGGTVQYTTNTTVLVGSGTKFTEDVSEGDTLSIAGVNVVIKSIASDTQLIFNVLDANGIVMSNLGWPTATGSGTANVYRLRPIEKFFGTFIYPDTAMLGTSGLVLGDMMVNFTSPVIEVPQINATMLVSGITGGTGSVSSDCGEPGNPPNPGINRLWDDFAKLTEWKGRVITLPRDKTYFGLFTDYVVDHVPNLFHIIKSIGQTHYDSGSGLHAVDAVWYVSPTPFYNGGLYQVVDIVSSSKDPANARPQWAPVCAPDTRTPPTNLRSK